MTLKTKLMMFIPLVLLGMAVAVALFLYGRTAFEVQEHHRFDIAQLENRIGEVRSRFLQMRLNEKDFLLRMDETYAARHAEASEGLRHELADLRTHAARLGGALDVPEFAQIEAALDRYLAVFHELVEVEVERGLDDEAGLVGELREAGGAVESLVGGFDQPDMMIKIQMMRRYEEDFILQVDRKYVDLHTVQVSEFKAFPADLFGGPAIRAEVLEKIDAYHEIFEEFADVSLHEQEARGAVSAAYAGIEALLVKAEQAVTEANAHAVAAIDETERRIWTIVYSGVGIASLVIALVAALTAFSVSRPLRATALAMSRLAQGQDDVEVPGLRRRDEIGDIARAFEGVQELTVERARRAQEAEKASTEERHAREAEEHARAQEEARRREVERQQLDATVGRLAEGLDRLSAGDLTHRIETPFMQDLEHLRQTYNGVMGRLQETIGVVDTAAREVLKGSQDIRGSAETLSSQAIGQAASLEETAATMEEISETVKTNAQNAAAVSRLAVETRGQAEKGREIVAETVEAMANIRSGASEISEIVTTIDAIAFQTNLLALNAAVEAARAGDAGKGFAVVASEVRTLAQRSSEAAKTIGALIGKSTSQVAEGDRLVGATDKALSEILEGVREVASTIEDIANASREQTTGVEEVSSTVGRMDEVTQQNAGTADRSASAARSLAEQSQKLVALVEAFDTGGRGRARAGTGADSERAA